jgi:hypothetical protein
MRIRRRTLLVVLVLVAAAVVAFLARSWIEQRILQPLIFLFWVLGVYYKMLPQALTWIVLVGLILMLEVGSFSGETRLGEGRHESRKPHQGGVELLAGWLHRAHGGLYYKWLVAQRLGRLARDMVAFNARKPASTGSEALKDPSWNPPAPVAAYLESGLNGSFADFPRPRWSFQRPAPTPLDLDPAQVIDVIEAGMEKD